MCNGPGLERRMKRERHGLLVYNACSAGEHIRIFRLLLIIAFDITFAVIYHDAGLSGLQCSALLRPGYIIYKKQTQVGGITSTSLGPFL